MAGGDRRPRDPRVVLAVPFFSMRLGVADAGNDPTKLTTRRAYDLLSQGFGPGINGPLLVAGDAKASDRPTAERLRAAIKADPDVAQVSPVIQSPKGVLIQVVPKGSPQDESTTQLVHRLRDDVIPGRDGGTGLDDARRQPDRDRCRPRRHLGQRLPYMFLAILLLSFVLLMLVFRSLLVPLKAVIMNLLSIGAAYGVIVAIFQWGWVKSLVGIGKEGPIEAWVPMMLFAIVFGLSMDYEVFLLSRIKEEYDAHGDNSLAVAHGLAKTARLITAAAAIMICVFGSFVLSDLRVLKLIGFGLAFAVFIDATLVRLVLVPATMELLGDRNWWLPSWLEWLPRVQRRGRAVAGRHRRTERRAGGRRATTRSSRSPLSALGLAEGVALGDGLALVVAGLAPRRRQLDLGPAVLEVDAERHERRAPVLERPRELDDLLVVQQQLAGAHRVELAPRELVGRHVHAVQPDLAVLDARVGVLEVGAAVADRLHLGPLEHDAALVRVQHEVVVARLAIGDDDLVAAAST